MRKLKLIYVLPLFLFASILFASNFNSSKLETATKTDATAAAESDENFDKMMAVLTHPRCVNCHPAGNKPIKGGDSHVTRVLGIPRGAEGHGTEAINCSTCHGEENNDYSGVPGAPHWALAPESMTWEGLNRVEIARSMMNKKNNGNRSLEELVKHLTEHELVLWAWNPGVDSEGIPRIKPPVPKEEYIAAVKAWAAAGAHIPEK